MPVGGCIWLPHSLIVLSYVFAPVAGPFSYVASLRQNGFSLARRDNFS